jgi:hypothetical protein
MTRNHRNAIPQGRAENSAIGSMDIQPDWGSAAKGIPAMTCGFHAGIWPAAKLFPRKQKFGSHHARTSFN